jgi:phage gp29-like protein
MAELVRADGVTPLRAMMVSDIAAAAPMAGRSATGFNPSVGLTPAGLAQILSSAAMGSPLAYLELAEAMEEKYLHYVAVLGTRKRQVSQLDITVEAASDRPIDQDKAQLIRDWLKRDTLEAELFDMLDAVGKGFSLTEIIWGSLDRRPWLPERLEWRDPRWFDFDQVDRRTPLLRTGSGPQPLPPYKFIYHVHGAKSGLPIRGGLARSAAWAYLFQNFALKDWVSFAEVYGFPIRLGKYGAGANAEQIRTLKQAVTEIAQDAAAVIPDSMLIELLETNGTGSSALYKDLAEYCDKQVSKAVLGQTATTDSEGGGLGGSGAQHNDVRADIERADGKLLAATLNRDLVRPIIDLNFGLPTDGSAPLYPQINVGRPDKEDLSALMDGVERFVAMGGAVAKSVIRDRLNLPDPQAGEELLVPAGTTSTPIPANGGAAPAATPGGPMVPEIAARGFLGPLKPSHGAIAAATADAIKPTAPAGDDIDALVQLLADEGWQATLGPIVDPLVAAMAGAGSYKAALAAMVPALAAMDAGALAARLERAAFAVRAAAATGADGQLGAGAFGDGE